MGRPKPNIGLAKPAMPLVRSKGLSPQQAVKSVAKAGQLAMMQLSSTNQKQVAAQLARHFKDLAES